MSQRTRGWYVGTIKVGDEFVRFATYADSPLMPERQGWRGSPYWMRTHWFDGHELPICGKASRPAGDLEINDERHCGHCERGLRKRRLAVA